MPVLIILPQSVTDCWSTPSLPCPCPPHSETLAPPVAPRTLRITHDRLLFSRTTRTQLRDPSDPDIIKPFIPEGLAVAADTADSSSSSKGGYRRLSAIYG